MHVRAVLVAAAALSFANGLLIPLSCLLGARGMAIAISAVVALFLLGFGFVLLAWAGITPARWRWPDR
jgi:hypothetical protein